MDFFKIRHAVEETVISIEQNTRVYCQCPRIPSQLTSKNQMYFSQLFKYNPSSSTEQINSGKHVQCFFSFQ
jgi:hypothetical protein